LPLELASLDDAAAAPFTSSASESSFSGVGVELEVGRLPESTASLTESSTKQSSQLDSLLLSKLPRELRDKIYREAVLEDIEIPIHVAHYMSKDCEQCSRLELEPALMLVCKQTRQEVAEIYYLENTFRITNDLFEPRAIAQLSSALDPWADKIKELEISHEFWVNTFGTVEMDLSVSVSQGWITIEPLTHSIHSLNKSTRVFAASTTNRLCYCEALILAVERSGDNVLNWAQKYVSMMVKRKVGARRYGMYCWTCAGITTI
jgi:hypothetical protein